MVLWLFLWTGCGSSWRLREGEKLAIGCPTRDLWQDSDADGWGDPDVTPQPLCEPDAVLGFTAEVGLDCDDDDPEVTGRVGSLCPEDLAAGEPAGTLGLEWGGVEYVAAWGPELDTSDAVAAAVACAAWAGPAALEPAEGLVAFAAAIDVETVTARLSVAVGAGRVFAGWIDAGWEGAVDDGVWSWVGLGDDGLLGGDTLPWCGEIPEAVDAWPELNAADPEHRAAMEEELSGLRLSLNLDALGGFCVGLPVEAGDGVTDASYGPWQAHPVCARARPDPALWSMTGAR